MLIRTVPGAFIYAYNNFLTFRHALLGSRCPECADSFKMRVFWMSGV